MFTKVLLLLFLGTINTVHCFETLHLSDFIEFHSSLSHCKNYLSVTEEQEEQYTECISKNLPNPPGVDDDDYFNQIYRRVCSNEEAYKKCWDPIIRKSKECNFANGKGYPTSFSLLVKAVCKKDKGQRFLDKLAKSINATEALEGDEEEWCAGTSGEHWMIACKDFDIDSPDVCKKHAGLTKCMEKITCTKVPTGKLFVDLHRKAGKIGRCSSRSLN